MFPIKVTDQSIYLNIKPAHPPTNIPAIYQRHFVQFALNHQTETNRFCSAFLSINPLNTWLLYLGCDPSSILMLAKAKGPEKWIGKKLPNYPGSPQCIYTCDSHERNKIYDIIDFRILVGFFFGQTTFHQVHHTVTVVAVVEKPIFLSYLFCGRPNLYLVKHLITLDR